MSSVLRGPWVAITTMPMLEWIRLEGLRAMTAAAEAFAGSGIEVDDLGLKRPTLDDVFLNLTGHRAEEPTDSADVEDLR